MLAILFSQLLLSKFITKNLIVIKKEKGKTFIEKRVGKVLSDALLFMEVAAPNVDISCYFCQKSSLLLLPFRTVYETNDGWHGWCGKVCNSRLAAAEEASEKASHLAKRKFTFIF